MENAYRQTSPQTIQKWENCLRFDVVDSFDWWMHKLSSNIYIYIYMYIYIYICIIVTLLSCIKFRLCARNTEADVRETICCEISTSTKICGLLEKDKQVLFLSKHKAKS